MWKTEATPLAQNKRDSVAPGEAGGGGVSSSGLREQGVYLPVMSTEECVELLNDYIVHLKLM